MIHFKILIPLIFTSAISFGQGLVKIGDKVPNYNLTKIINSQKTSLDIADLKGKPVVIAFWGTWCPPCIPEIISLGKLQKKFGNKVQIIAISNDNEQKLKFFLQKRPNAIWFASDPSQNLWNIFGLSTAGFVTLIDRENKIVAITETHLVDSTVIENLINSKQLNLKENRGETILSENEESVKIDSSTIYSFVIQSELPGIASMTKRPNSGYYANRRITVINFRPARIIINAFGINTAKKVFYAKTNDSIMGMQNRICVDLIVSDSEKENINYLFQNELNKHLPVKGEIQKKLIACYVLRPIPNAKILINETVNIKNKFSFNSLDFNGEGISFSTFINYLENELNFPIYDATNLTKHYNIDFSKNNIERLNSIKENLAKMGLELFKDEKEMDVLIISSK